MTELLLEDLEDENAKYWARRALALLVSAFLLHLLTKAVTNVCKAIFHYTNGDPSNTDAFLCIARERIKPYIDESWMPWCEELIAGINLQPYDGTTFL